MPTVFVPPSNRRGRDEKYFHTDPDCGYLKRAGGVEKPLNVLGGNWEYCLRCAARSTAGRRAIRDVVEADSSVELVVSATGSKGHLRVDGSVLCYAGNSQRTFTDVDDLPMGSVCGNCARDAFQAEIVDTPDVTEKPLVADGGEDCGRATPQGIRVYHGAPSPENLRRCREAAPSHVHGACWTPQKMVTHDVPYFVDNGAFTSDFDPEAWRELLAAVDEEMPHPPDFVVLPDAFNDADGTLERHREFVEDVLGHGFRPAPVLQPGRSVTSQVAIVDGLGADTVFVGGECRWQRAHGEEIVAEAHDRGLRVHIGNPGSADGLVWAFRAGFDSVDTSSILQNQYFHWLEDLEAATHSSKGSGKKASRQSALSEVTRVAE